jgi:hypothetical protein
MDGELGGGRMMTGTYPELQALRCYDERMKSRLNCYISSSSAVTYIAMSPEHVVVM